MRAASGSVIRRGVNALFGTAMLLAGSSFATEQQVMFAPSIATVADDGKGAISIQGRISETPTSLKRRWIIDNFPLRIKPDPDRQDPLFRDRAGRFWSDSDTVEPVSVQLGARVLILAATDSGGYFNMKVPLTSDETAQLVRAGAIEFTSLVTETTPVAASGVARLVAETGMTVITDVDDTIKITEITNKPERDANTFVRPFKAVPWMAEVYSAWQQAYGPALHFHVVSAGPWQLHEPVRQFTEHVGFPPFTWHMRSMKITDFDSLLEALDPEVGASRREEFKVQAIREFMALFRKRHVVLVGDSGEQDPEVYARILAEFGDRVSWVLIRDVSDDPKLAKKNRAMLFARPEHAAKLRVFSDPRQLLSLPLSPLRHASK